MTFCISGWYPTSAKIWLDFWISAGFGQKAGFRPEPEPESGTALDSSATWQASGEITNWAITTNSGRLLRNPMHRPSSLTGTSPFNLLFTHYSACTASTVAVAMHHLHTGYTPFPLWQASALGHPCSWPQHCLWQKLCHSGPDGMAWYDMAQCIMYRPSYHTVVCYSLHRPNIALLY